MEMFTPSERRMLRIVRLSALAICGPVLALALYFESLLPAVVVAPVLALFVAFEGFALVKRFRWTMRSPKEIARARREAREREEAR